MRFRSPNPEKPIHVALTSGHTLVIPHEGCEVSEIFRREAIALGAELMDSSGDVIAAAAQAPAVNAQSIADNRKELIKNALRTMLNGANEDDFTDKGLPNLKRLQAVAGFNVPRTEADAAWAEVQAEESAKQAAEPQQ